MAVRPIWPRESWWGGQGPFRGCFEVKKLFTMEWRQHGSSCSRTDQQRREGVTNFQAWSEWLKVVPLSSSLGSWGGQAWGDWGVEEGGGEKSERSCHVLTKKYALQESPLMLSQHSATWLLWRWEGVREDPRSSLTQWWASRSASFKSKNKMDPIWARKVSVKSDISFESEISIESGWHQLWVMQGGRVE